MGEVWYHQIHYCTEPGPREWCGDVHPGPQLRVGGLTDHGHQCTPEGHGDMGPWLTEREASIAAGLSMEDPVNLQGSIFTAS